MSRYQVPALVLSVLSLAAAAPGGSEPARRWGEVLERHHQRGGLNYASLSGDRAALVAYLSRLAQVRPESLSRDAQLAFWINAYNAVVVRHVLERYPGIVSVKKVDGFFDKLKFPVAGRPMSLDEIERQGRDLDPRVHFAMVCASASCPDLRSEPYLPAKIDQQLEEQTGKFLADPLKGLRYDEKTHTLWLSSIFKWYGADFDRNHAVEWLVPHVSRELAARIEAPAPTVKYLDYDWTLNDRPGEPKR